jgi:hypothetical protein
MSIFMNSMTLARSPFGLTIAALGLTGCSEKAGDFMNLFARDDPKLQYLLVPNFDQSQDAVFNPGESFFLTVVLANQSTRNIRNIRGWLHFDDSRIEMDPSIPIGYRDPESYHSDPPYSVYNGACADTEDNGNYDADGRGVEMGDFEQYAWNQRQGLSYDSCVPESDWPTRGIVNHSEEETPPDIELTERRYETYGSAEGISEIRGGGFVTRLKYFDPGEYGTEIRGTLRLHAKQPPDEEFGDEFNYFGPLIEEDVAITVMPLDARPELSFSGVQDSSSSSSWGSLNNGNAKVNPGESIAMDFELSRSGFGNLGLTRYTLTIPSMDVSLTRCSLSSGVSAWEVQQQGDVCSFDVPLLGGTPLEFDLEIEVSQTVTPGTDFAVNLSAYDDIGNQWNDSISIPIKESDVEFVLNDYSINETSYGSDNDGIPDAGEEISVDVSGENIGTDIAVGLTGVCTTLDDYVTISAGEDSLGTIEPGQSYDMDCNDIELHEDMPSGHAFTVFVTTWDSLGGLYVNEVVVTEGAGAINLTFSDEIEFRQVSGDSDGLVEGGERFHMDIEIENTGSHTADSVNVGLTCTDLELATVDPESSMTTSDLDPGERETFTWELTVLGGHPGQEAGCNFHVVADLQEFNQHYTFDIAEP